MRPELPGLLDQPAQLELPGPLDLPVPLELPGLLGLLVPLELPGLLGLPVRLEFPALPDLWVQPELLAPLGLRAQPDALKQTHTICMSRLMRLPAETAARPLPLEPLRRHWPWPGPAALYTSYGAPISSRSSLM